MGEQGLVLILLAVYAVTFAGGAALGWHRLPIRLAIWVGIGGVLGAVFIARLGGLL